MKVKDLIKALEQTDQDAEIEFPLHTYTQTYPSVYVNCEPVITKAPDQNHADGYSVVRITIHHNELWCVSGKWGNGGGILEWCYDEADAISVLKEMRKDNRFSNLKAEKYIQDSQ